MTIPPNSWQPLDLPLVAWNHWQDVRRRDDITSLNISFPFGRMPGNLVIQCVFYLVSTCILTVHYKEPFNSNNYNS